MEPGEDHLREGKIAAAEDTPGKPTIRLWGRPRPPERGVQPHEDSSLSSLDSYVWELDKPRYEPAQVHGRLPVGERVQP